MTVAKSTYIAYLQPLDFDTTLFDVSDGEAIDPQAGLQVAGVVQLFDVLGA
jgi:hypothetical protein